MNHIQELLNVSFVIPVRIDSYERSRNLDLLLDFILHHFKSKIYIMEADSSQHYILKEKHPQVEYHFIKDENPVFQHTLYLNYLYQLVTTSIIAGWDTDAIVPATQITEVVNQIESGKAVMGLPYNGIMYATDPIHLQMYTQSGDIGVLQKNIPYMFPMYGSLSMGGAFIVNRNEYLQSGGDNENFLGWGPEDFERIKRMEILYPEFPIYRASGSLFHLWHPRLLNSGYANIQYEQNGKQEFIKICSMTTEELRTYISTWPWLDRFKIKTYE